MQDFLAQKKIAVVGVSDKRETLCNLNYTNSRRQAIRCTRSTRAYPLMTARRAILTINPSRKNLTHVHVDQS